MDLTQQQEKALLYGMGVPPKRRFQSMEEFHTALYEGFVPGAAEEGGQRPASAPEEDHGAGGGDKTVETAGGGEARPAFDPIVWLKQNKLLAGGIAAALALVILLAAVLPRLLGPSKPTPSPAPAQTGEPADTPPVQEPAADPEVDYLSLFMETVEWLRLDDVEVDEAELRARLDALPIDELFADAVHVTTLAELNRALDQADKPIVIDADIDFSGDNSGDSHRNNRVPVLISGGVTVSGAWENYGRYENVPKNADAYWTVDGSILVNRGTMRGRVTMGDWDNDGVMDTNVLLNYGTIYSDLDAGYGNDSYNVMVNLGTIGIPASQYRQTSFYNLGTLLHGTIVPEGETPLITTPLGGDYFMDFIGGFFYNAGEIVLEGQSSEKRSRLDVAYGTRFANYGSIRLGNYGEITATESTGGVNNEGWLVNAGPDCALDTAHCYNVGLVQAGPETPVDLSTVSADGSGAVLSFSWQESMEQLEGYHLVTNEEEFYQALEDRDCAWIVLNGTVSLTLTENLVLTKGLAIPDVSSLTMESASLTVTGENGYLSADGPVDLRGGVLTVRDEAVAAVNEMRDCGGVTVKNQGYLMLCGGLLPNDGAEIQLSDARYLCSIGPMELHGARVSVDNGLLRGTGGVELYGCTVDIGERGEFLTSGCGLYFAPDTVITNYGGVAANGWDTEEFACQFTNYGRLSSDDQMVISGTLVNHGHFCVWTGPGLRIRVSGSLEDYGTVELSNGGQLQPWAAGTVTGVPEQYVAK